MVVHLIKLCVGIESPEHLAAVQRRRLDSARRDGLPPVLHHRTRQRPRRADEILAGGSLYWVIRGFVRLRQRVVGIEPTVDADGVPRCLLVLDPELVPTAAVPRRPFQGWRYLEAGDAPPDLPASATAEDGPPPEMAAELRALGLL